jgi:hypothetical protein
VKLDQAESQSATLSAPSLQKDHRWLEPNRP